MPYEGVVAYYVLSLVAWMSASSRFSISIFDSFNDIDFMDRAFDEFCKSVSQLVTLEVDDMTRFPSLMLKVLDNFNATKMTNLRIKFGAGTEEETRATLAKALVVIPSSVHSNSLILVVMI